MANTDAIDNCHRCGKKHLSAPVWLELDSWTGRWDVPGGIAKDRSQGVFRFGNACAKRQLAPVGTNPRQRGDDDGVEYADPREVL
jgi:hypothetical protein